MFARLNQWMKDRNITWKDVAAVIIIGLALIWLTNHVLEHMCLC